MRSEGGGVVKLCNSPYCLNCICPSDSDLCEVENLGMGESEGEVCQDVLTKGFSSCRWKILWGKWEDLKVRKGWS